MLTFDNCYLLNNLILCIYWQKYTTHIHKKYAVIILHHVLNTVQLIHFNNVATADKIFCIFFRRFVELYIFPSEFEFVYIFLQLFV